MSLKPTPYFARWLALAGFVLLIFGSKLWFISYAGSDLPTWDQWDGESACLLQPWLQHELNTETIFHPHNEHRIVTTKLYMLGLFVANDGQWSALVETTANALVHTFCALFLLLLARRWLRGGWLVAFGGLLVLLFTLPFSWENTLFGFQVQFYLLLLFSLAQIRLTLGTDRFGGGWACGLLCGLLAVVTMASGFLASLAVLAVLGHRVVRERRLTAQQVVTAILAMACVVAGLLLKVEVPGHAALKIRGAGEFIGKFSELITWPVSNFLPWSLILGVPALLFLIERLRLKTTPRDEAVLLGLLAWILLQCGATAYARGGGPVLASRYLDLLTVNVALGFILLVRGCEGRARRLFAAGWMVAVAAALLSESRQQWTEYIEPNIPHQWQQEANVRAYLLTHDATHLLGKPWGEIPYPDGTILLERLASPAIQAAMPPIVRRPVAIIAPGDRVPAAVPAGLPPPASPIAVSTWDAPAGKFSWRSPVQPPSARPVLRFRVAGDLGPPGRRLHLTVKSADGTAEVVPDFAPGERWKTVNIFRPSGPWWIEAEDAEANGWFAFTEPVEVGRLSWLAEKLLKLHFLFLFAGVGGLAAAAAIRRFTPDESIA